MVAKGHDFHDVVLGVVVDADSTLRFPDLRAEERTFASSPSSRGAAAAASARAGSWSRPSRPEADAIARAAAHDAAGFLAGELERRRELGYPPFAHLIRIELSHPDARRLDDGRRRAARGARRLPAARGGGDGAGAPLSPPRPRAPPAPGQGARARRRGRRDPRDRARRGARPAACAGSRSPSTSTRAEPRASIDSDGDVRGHRRTARAYDRGRRPRRVAEPASSPTPSASARRPRSPRW